jgi:hypothetical protein
MTKKMQRETIMDAQTQQKINKGTGYDGPLLFAFLLFPKKASDAAQ